MAAARSVCDIHWDEPFLSSLAFCGGKLQIIFTLRYSVFTFIAAARPAWCLFMRNSGFTYDFHSPLESSWLSSNLPWRPQNCPSALTESFFVVATCDHWSFSFEFNESLIHRFMLWTSTLHAESLFKLKVACFLGLKSLGFFLPAFVFPLIASAVIVPIQVTFKYYRVHTVNTSSVNRGVMEL